MAEVNRKHFIEKAKERVLRGEVQADGVNAEVMNIFESLAVDTETKIRGLTSKFADDNGIDIVRARELLKGKEFTAWRYSMEEYIDKIEKMSNEAEKSALLLEMNTLAMKSRVSREEQLLGEIYGLIGESTGAMNEKMDDMLSDIITTNYYRSCYDIQMGAKIAFPVAKIDKHLVNELLSDVWAKKTYSKTVWDNADTIAQLSKRVITKGMIGGYSVDKMAKEINDTMKKGKYAAERLVRTECKLFANQAEKLAYKEHGVDKYVYMGEPESSHYKCDCSFYNGKIIDLDRAEAYVNYPPLHPNCKCTTRAYFEKSIFDNNKDCVHLKAEDDLSYKEWQEKFIDEVSLNDGTNGSIMKLTATKHAYERFKERGLDMNDIKSSVENPIKIYEAKVDEKGRKSKKYVGEELTVVLNIDTGNVITVWKTGKKKIKQIMKE